MSREGNRPAAKKPAWGYDEGSSSVPEINMTDTECLNALQNEYKLAEEKFVTYPTHDKEVMRVLRVWGLDLIEGVDLVDMKTGEEIHYPLKAMLLLLKGGLWKVGN